MSGNRLLAIDGGPHRAGVTGKMLDCAVEAAERAGWEVTCISLYGRQISYCTGCRICLDTGTCVLEDDLAQVASLIRQSDMIVLAAPVYWANVPAAVKNLFDRMLGTAMEETGRFPKPRLSGKRYVFLTACNTCFPFSVLCGQTTGAYRAVAEFFRTAGVKRAGRFACAGTGRGKGLPAGFQGKMNRFWRNHKPASHRLLT